MAVFFDCYLSLNIIGSWGEEHLYVIMTTVPAVNVPERVKNMLWLHLWIISVQYLGMFLQMSEVSTGVK